MVNCVYCGAENQKNAKYCQKCGKPIMVTDSSSISGVKPVPQPRVITPIAGGIQYTQPRTVPSVGMCFYHQNLRASYICNRCGRQICADCAKAHGDMVFCPQCYSGVATMVPPTLVQTLSAEPELATQRSRTIVGTLFALFGGLLVIFGAAAINAGLVPSWVSFIRTWVWVDLSTFAVIGVLCGAVMLLGSALMLQRNYEVIGASLVVAFALVSLIVMGGFFVGLILGMIGAILGALKK